MLLGDVFTNRRQSVIIRQELDLPQMKSAAVGAATVEAGNLLTVNLSSSVAAKRDSVTYRISHHAWPAAE